MVIRRISCTRCCRNAMCCLSLPRERSDTRGLIGASQLALLRPGSHVIVLSRGGIVDETALAEALRTGHIGAAWVDAYLKEPPANSHPLFDAPNVTLTPHMSGVYRRLLGHFSTATCRECTAACES